MKLQTLVRKGKFNWANPSEISVSIHIEVVNDVDAKKYINLRFPGDSYEYWKYAFDSDPIEASIEAIKEYEDTHITGDKLREVKKAFFDHYSEFFTNQMKKEIKKHKEKIKEHKEKLEKLEHSLEIEEK